MIDNLTTNHPENNGLSMTEDKKSSHAELRSIYVTFYKDLYYYGLKLSGSEEITRDCIQDMFLQFWMNENALSEVNSTKAYLLKCYRRRVISELTQNNNKKSRDAESGIRQENELIVDSIESDLIHEEDKKAKILKLIKAKDELTKRQKEILYLKFNLGYDYEMICEIMSIKYQSVRNLFSEAIKILQDKLTQD